MITKFNQFLKESIDNTDIKKSSIYYAIKKAVDGKLDRTTTHSRNSIVDMVYDGYTLEMKFSYNYLDYIRHYATYTLNGKVGILEIHETYIDEDWFGQETRNLMKALNDLGYKFTTDYKTEYNK